MMVMVKRSISGKWKKANIFIMITRYLCPRQIVYISLPRKPDIWRLFLFEQGNKLLKYSCFRIFNYVKSYFHDQNILKSTNFYIFSCLPRWSSKSTSVSMITFNQITRCFCSPNSISLLPFVDVAWPFPPSEYFI